MLSPIVRTVLASLLMSALIGPTAAATKCEVKTSTCIDARTGQARICQTTICKDDKGEIVSIDTIVLKETAPTAGPTGPKGKAQLKELNVIKKIDKASPQ